MASRPLGKSFHIYALRSLRRALRLAVVIAPAPQLAAQPPAHAARTPQGPSTSSPAPDSLAHSRILARLQSTAVARSPELVARRAELDAARARAEASGFASPVSVSAGISEAPYASLDQGNVRVEFGRELFTGWRRRAERALADADVWSAEVSLFAAERGVRLSILREVVRAAAARLVAARLTAEDGLLAGGEDGVRARFAVGEARYVDVLRLRTERLRVQTERASTLAEARAATAALRGLLGVTATSGLPQGTSGDGLVAALDTLASPGLADAWRRVLPESTTTDSLIEAVTAAAGDVRLADVAVARARAAQALDRAGRRPQVAALAGVQRIGQANSGPTFGPSVGVTISLPFTAARANRLGATASERQVAAAESTRVAARSAVRARVEAAVERYAAARERLSVYDAALLRGARDERESALASYRSGALSLIELVDFERALARAEIDRLRALVDAADAWADLASGGADADSNHPSTSTSGQEAASHAR